MKPLLEINVGLSTPKGQRVKVKTVRAIMKINGFLGGKSRVYASISEDGPEKCLAWAGKPAANWQGKLKSLAKTFGQDCISFRLSGFAGPRPYSSFNPSLFKTT